MSWASELPTELLSRPTGLVILTGLDLTYNAIHKSIWDSFCNNRRPDRVPLHFKIFSGDHEYPKSRPKHTSYEWYIPKGILKTGWLNKHLNVVPAVVVIFFDLDWDEAMWKEKQMECATLVEIVRSELQGRNTKVAVVLIQKNAPLPPGEDVMAAERAASLCSTCDLSAKSLFVLPHNTDHLLGYTIRLENAFYELSQSYYHAEARKVKSHKDFLNKTNHQLLFVRHQFKIAFFNEAKQDTHTALKHYKAAYGHVIDLRMHENNTLEIKTISGFINYKICRLSFQHNVPLDAIAQFRKHIDFYKGRVNIAELAFEHSAWMSKQFQVFGDLFDEAIKLGLTAIQTQHPGVYYQQAANHAIARKQLCVGLCRRSESSTATSDPLENLGSLDYYGQRPWRPSHQRIEQPDAQKEMEGIQALQNLELTVDHSWIIIPLLGSAVAQFKKYKSPRMKRYLMVQMGEEYFHAKDYSKALTLLKKVTWDYRTEKWWPLLTSILETALKCAYLVASVQDYVTICLEMIGQYTTCSLEDKTRIQMNLIRVMSNDVAEPEPGLQGACVDGARELWTKLVTQPSVFNVDMQTIVPFVECKALFHADSFAADGQIAVSVYVRISCQFPLRFSRLTLTFNNHLYNQYCVVTDGQGISASSEVDTNSGDLYLTPGVVKKYEFSFYPLKEDVASTVKITSVCLELGSEPQRCAILQWPTVDNNHTSNVLSDVLKLPYDWSLISPQHTTKINPRAANVDICLTHDPPALVSEFYCLTVSITNNEHSPITSANLSMELTEADSALELNTHLSLEKPEFTGKVRKQTEVSLNTIAPNEKVQKTIFIKCLQTGSRTFTVKASYNIDVSIDNFTVSCTCTAECRFELAVHAPFEVSTRLTSLHLEPIETVHSGEPFLLMPEIMCVSPWQLELGRSELQLESGSRLADEYRCQIEGVQLSKSESACECHCILSQWEGSLGAYVLHWRRKHDDLDLPFVTSHHPLPRVTVEHVPVYIDLQLPAYGSVKSLLTLAYVLHNQTPYMQEVEMAMDSSDNFMFAGNKHIHFRVLPQNQYTLRYNLYPLIPGHVTLPKVHVNVTRYPGIDDVIQKMLPSHIFIKDVYNELPTMLEAIFGFGTEEGWRLDEVSRSYSSYTFDVLRRFLSPSGVLFKVIQTLQQDPNMLFDFPISCLPITTQNSIEDGSMSQFIANRLHLGTNGRPLLLLDAFELYMFHFAYYLVNPQHRRTHTQWHNLQECLYPVVLEDYQSHFLPLTPRNTPTSSPLVHSTPHLRHSPLHHSPSLSPIHSGSLLRHSVIATRQQTHAIGHDPQNSELSQSDSFIQGACVDGARELWTKLVTQPSVFNVDMQTIVPFVECKALFHADSFAANGQIAVSVYIRISCQFPLRFSRLTLTFNNHLYNQYCVVTDGQGISASSEVDTNSGDLYLTPGVVKKYEFSFYPLKEDVASTVKITSVCLELGSEPQRCAILQWPTVDNNHTSNVLSDALKLPYDWSLISPQHITKINPRAAHVDICLTHDPPALVSEFYCLTVSITNNEPSPITSANLSMELTEADSALELNTHLSLEKPEFTGKVRKQTEVSLNTIAPNEKVQKTIFIKCLQTGSRTFTVKASYNIDVSIDNFTVSCTCTAECRFELAVHAPFEVSTRLTSLHLEPIETVHSGEPFLLMPEIMCVSPWQLELGRSELQLESGSRLADEYRCQIEGEHVPVYIDLQLPAYGSVKSLLTLAYVLHNQTPYMQEVEMAMDSSDNFMFAGNKHIHFRVLPQNQYTLRYNLYPLIPGHVTLPKVHVNVTRYPGIDDVIQKMLPSHIFIKPSGKMCSLPL